MQTVILLCCLVMQIIFQFTRLDSSVGKIHVGFICKQLELDIHLRYIFSLLLIHYANMSVQYTAIFHGCKNDNFQMKFLIFFLFFAQNIDCGYTLEPPQ